jgi:tRNA (Thr-GGU) A37 N-methylase
MRPVGVVRGGRSDPIDDGWDRVSCQIVLDPAQFSAEATAGLADFSHIEVIYSFNRVPDNEVQKGARYPRGRKDWPKVGIFAQGGKGRPNCVGVTACTVLSVDGLKISVQGLDAFDGTPVLDIKPVMTRFLPRGPIREPDWAQESMKQYW